MLAVSSLQQDFWWHRRRHSHARTGRIVFYNKNIRVPFEGSFTSRRAYTCNGSGGASFGTVMTRNIIIFIYIKNNLVLNTFYYKQHVDINIIININIKSIIFILNNKELNI